MLKPEIPVSEAQRIQALTDYSILDTLPEEEYDEITMLASYICGTSMSFISLIDVSRQWFKSHYGLDVEQTEREYSFCAHAINQPTETLMVPDARLDERFFDNPLVTGDPNLAFYAGVPVVTPEGHAIGALCVADRSPKNLTEAQLDALRALCNQLSKLLELRKKNMILAENQQITKRLLHSLEESQKIARVGGWEVDVPTGKVSWTEITREIHEVSGSLAPELEAAINFYKEGRSRETIRERLNNLINNGVFFDDELEIISAKGANRWVRVKGEAELVNGKCVRIYGIFQDINQQKLKDIQLARSEEQFRQMFNQSAIGMALVDLNGKWIKVNKGLSNIVGYTQEELYQKTFQYITHPEDVGQDVRKLQEMKEGIVQSYQLEKRYIHKHGHTVWIILSAAVVKDEQNRPSYVVSQIVNITARKLAEQIIREDRKLLTTLIDNVPINIYIKDLRHRKILVNQKEVEHMDAASKADILGKDDYQLYPRESADISFQEDREVFKTEKPLIDKETLNIKKDGTENWFLTSKILLRNEQNEMTGLLGISYNINERKKTEKKLAELAAVLNEQNTRLLNFSHIVSHNLRTHAANFESLLEMLETETGEAERQELFDFLKLASDNLTTTVAHLTDIVEINTSINNELRTLNLCQAIQSVQDNIKALLHENGVECINLVSNDTCIKAVPAYLDSILLNFFTNSIKYKSATAPPLIRLQAVQQDKYILLQFSDNGLGIDLKKHGEKLFGMHKTFHDHKDARGIGLYITKNQVEAMGGKIEVESKPGDGTTFIIYFLAAEA